MPGDLNNSREKNREGDGMRGGWVLGLLTIPGDSLYDSLQQLVHECHVQQMEGEEVSVEDGPQDGAQQEDLEQEKQEDHLYFYLVAQKVEYRILEIETRASNPTQEHMRNKGDPVIFASGGSVGKV